MSLHSSEEQKICLQTNLYRHISIYSWDITTSCLEKQTSAILEFFFRLRLRQCYSASDYQISSKWGHPRKSNDDIYIFKMAAAAAPYYFRFRIWWCHSVPKVNVCQQTKFRNLINGRDITTSVCKNNRPPYWNFTSGFDFVHITILRMSLCISSKSVHPQRRYDVISMFKMAAAAAQFYLRFQIGWRRSFGMSVSMQQMKAVPKAYPHSWTPVRMFATKLQHFWPRGSVQNRGLEGKRKLMLLNFQKRGNQIPMTKKVRTTLQKFRGWKLYMWGRNGGLNNWLWCWHHVSW